MMGAKLTFQPRDELVARERVQFYAPTVIAAVMAVLARGECDLLRGGAVRSQVFGGIRMRRVVNGLAFE
jgi:hypothetical protein